MPNLLTHGLSALMEACNMSEHADNENDSLFETFESVIDDDIIDAVAGKNLDDSVESDMDGEGVGDDSKMDKILEKIPPSDEDVDEEISNLVESVIPSDLAEYIG